MAQVPSVRATNSYRCVGDRVADRAKAAEIAGPGDQRGAHVSGLNDAAIHDVPVEHDERRQLDTPRVQDVAAAEGLSPGRLFQVTHGALVGVGQQVRH